MKYIFTPLQPDGTLTYTQYIKTVYVAAIFTFLCWLCKTYLQILYNFLNYYKEIRSLVQSQTFSKIRKSFTKKYLKNHTLLKPHLTLQELSINFKIFLRKLVYIFVLFLYPYHQSHQLPSIANEASRFNFNILKIRNFTKYLQFILNYFMTNPMPYNY